ncbi:MAG: YqgE/AlgH family protein [Proteobacteria bacterium]|nr:YqgE/AlgH family protein [Pseudomonadota bacterium]
MYLTNHFLIAMPSLQDPYFRQSVTYICEHNENGAFGIIINHPINLRLEHVFEQMEIKSENETLKQMPVLLGGPIHQERGFIIHRPSGIWRSSINTAPDICVTTSQDILQAIAENKGPEEFLVALGYAGWGEKQLEQEILSNSWLCCPANTNIIFETPMTERWANAAKLLGIDINQLSGDAGHA